MRKNILSIIGLGAVIIFAGCKKDNYEPPASTITGKVVYQNQPIGVRSNGVQLELWQSGYQLFTKIPVYVNQDGTFSASVFDGTYKLTRLKGNGPWIDNTDTITVKVSGNSIVDVPVTPYFTISNESFSYNPSDTSVSSTFKVNQVVAGKSIEKISLNVGLTQFVDAATNQLPFAPSSINDFNPPSDIAQPITLKVYLNPNRYPDLSNTNRSELRRQLGVILDRKYAFLRIGVKTTGIAERIYSSVKSQDLK